MCLGGVARADGDPASDVLATQSLFLPQDAGASIRTQEQLAEVLNAAARAGYPIRVAVIASAFDLGSVTELWRQPQTYARYLGEELSLVFRGPLLVVMRNGYGVYRATGATAAEQSAVATLPPPVPDLGSATIAAIRQLGAADGHPLPAPGSVSATSPGPGHTVAWLAFVLGAVLIAVAWALSFRARPLRAHTLRHSSD